MIPALPVDCGERAFIGNWGTRSFTMPFLHSTAWEAGDGRRAQIVVNPEDRDMNCRVGDAEVTVPALGAVLVEL